ncbi:DUF6069 family protein [Streptomyces neyagawaensis]|uniref:DUF6069 family protein n=1 Tax=Streptomyces neyagawaensis TaxID=42238 RepID=UPI0006E2DD8F|nr:DUF6069 family protein [Streptomyces neyagawaensis]MCL6735092.1 DUF6069 family protein [Streptomyces neyagawaensis]MDE1687487.1 DUF6069 family protein [Streptomyces neyagawaensis]
MSVTPEAVPIRRGPLVVAGGVLAAIVAASLADAVIALLALAVGAPDDFQPLEPGSYIFLTAVGMVAGVIGWAIVRKVSKDPEALMRWLVPTVVVVSFVPDFLLFGEGGVTGVVALLLMHVVVAVVAVFAYRKVMPLS